MWGDIAVDFSDVQRILSLFAGFVHFFSEPFENRLGFQR